MKLLIKILQFISVALITNLALESAAFKLREYCHNNRDMNLSEKLRSDGYYSYRFRSIPCIKHTIPERYCMFYNDGTAIFNYHLKYFRDTREGVF
ncbi:hypothetical protein GCM10023091_20730 [Ravibacter arvi]|uniref:Uncharacterized protein n=1 Tax=Ravibacter arvi TaxID=2051041 RepID=A0ABP8LX33_9BACT